MAQFPVIDAVPILIHPLAEYLRNHWDTINARQNLTSNQEAMLGDASGLGSRFNQQRHYLSCYVHSHYSDFDTLGKESSPFKQLVQQALALIPRGETVALSSSSLNIDAGCACGRSSFELASYIKRITVGMDLNFSLLRFAQQILIHGEADYPRKHCGLVYHRHRIEFQHDDSEWVDFWLADASNPPLPPASAGLCTAFNVLDAVNSPRRLLQSLAQQLSPTGNLLLTTPYDWSGDTPMANWIGGQAQYNDTLADSPALLRQCLEGENFRIIGEKETIDWHMRIHNRQVNHYQVHALAAQRNIPGGR